VRPHPEWIRRHGDSAQRILNDLKAVGGVEVESNAVTNDALLDADLLMTDWSSIAFEYAFATERPVLYVDTPLKVTNPEYEKIGLLPTEITVRNEIGVVVGLEELDGVAAAASKLLKNRSMYRDKIRKRRNEMVFNLGCSAGVIADHLVRFCGGSSTDGQS
jgi:YidC/Oxa1 family membrane protein insertase